MSAPVSTDDAERLASKGWRSCYRRQHISHHPDFLLCDCLRVEIPLGAQAKSSGRLATDHENMARDGLTARARVAIETCFPGFGKAWDRRIRQTLTRKRDANKIGRKA